jgi:hypothetical protein
VLGKQRLLAMIQQALTVGGALHLVGVVEHVLHRAELPHQVPGALVADPRHAGHVVDCVAHQG